MESQLQSQKASEKRVKEELAQAKELQNHLKILESTLTDKDKELEMSRKQITQVIATND